jgi:hypothetical protein
MQFVDWKWQKLQKPQTDVKQYNRSVQVSSWVTHLIITQPTHEDRKAVLSCILRVALSCWNIGNFNGAMEIVAGLKWVTDCMMWHFPVSCATYLSLATLLWGGKFKIKFYPCLNLMFCWLCIIVYQYSETSEMHFLYSVYYKLMACTCFECYLLIFRRCCTNNWYFTCMLCLLEEA